MTQDFAKIRPEPILERRPVAAPPAWSLMFTGMLVGVVIGVFACVMFYLSGNVPPLNNLQPPVVADVAADVVADTALQQPAVIEEEQVNFEFYTALPDYEVQVNSIPVQEDTPVPVNAPTIAEAANVATTITTNTPGTPLAMSVVLQSGAFQQQERANAEMLRQQGLGLDVRVKAESTSPGRTLYLVQSGPYATQSELAAAEQAMRAHNLPTLRISLR